MDDFKIKQLLKLRRLGWSYIALGYKYNQSPAFVEEICATHKVKIIKSKNHKPFPKREFNDPKPKDTKIGKYDRLLYEDINRGRSYQDYLIQDIQRKHKEV